MTTTTTRRRHKQPPASANRQINFINTSVTCNRLPPSKSRLVPLMILLTYSQLLLVSPPMAAKAHRHAANGAALKSILSTRNDDDHLKTRTKETTEPGAANNRRHPLLNAGHLNRMYYAPLEQSTQRRHKFTATSREDDLRSPNNRGPSLVLSQLDDVVVGHHLKSRPNQLRSEVSHYGERRRDHGDPDDTGVKFERRLLESRPAATPTSWSQPDPRRSYSAPVSRVKLVHASSMRRLYGGGGANAWRSSSANPRRTRFEPMMKRKEDAQASLEGTEASLLSTTSSSSSGGGGAANASIETTSNDFDHEPLDGAGDSTQQPQLPDDLNEIVPMGAVTGQWRSPIAQKTQKSARLVSTGSQPLVTVIRYVPIIVNVPAALASSVATPASSMKTKTVLLQQQQQHHHQQQASASESTNQQESNAATGSRGKMPMILASSSDQELTLAGNNDVPAGSNEFAQISGFPGGFSSSHEIQQALSSGLATPASAAELAQLAHAGQPVFARLAYIPLNQPLAQVGHGGLGGHMLPAGASHMTSKALAAYASKLISMLKPSHLLSSLGSGGSGSSQQYQTSQNYNHLQLSGAAGGGGGGAVPSNTQHHQQILLLAPSTESILASAALGAGVSTAGHAQRVQPAAQLGLKHAPSEPPARPPDLLINQASGVHSTKSQQQQQNQRDRVRPQPPAPLKDQQPRWPLMPQMNGLICVQGLIGTKQPGKTQTLQQSQEQVDLNSFDDEYEPKRPATQQQQQQQVVVASKGQRQQLPVARGLGERHGKGASSSLKPGKGPRAPGAKESPIRMMQQKMASKQQDEQYQQQQDISEKDFAQISQQKLVGLPSELKRDVIGSAGLASGQASGRQTTIGQTQPPAPLPASAANFQSGDEIRSDDARGRPIIPFTIRDKIDAPPSVNRAQTGGANNGPVQYDDDGGPADEPAGERGNMGGASEQRRSRTTFVSAGATGARGRGGSGQRVGVDISYKKEKPLAGQRDSSLPVLLASSAPSKAAAASHSPNGLQRETADRFATPHEFLNSRPPHYPLPRSPAPPRGLHLSSLHDEPIGASSSSSSVSTATTTTMFAATTGSGETTTAESAPTVPPPREQVLARADFETMARDDSSSLGQLVSSVSLTGSGSSSSSSAERPLIGTNTLTSTLATPTTNDTVELIVNSTPRETPITASPLDLRPTSVPGEGRAATGGGGNRSGEPLNQITSSSSTAVQSNAAETDTDDDSMLQLMSSNSFSHDRSLTPASERTGASYGRISESLQTNPLDLIDLQNSRSSFELPAQLESLSMLHTDNHDDDRGASSKDNNNNHAHDQLVTQRDKQHAAAAGEQHEREQRSRVLRGALNATAPLG